MLFFGEHAPGIRGVESRGVVGQHLDEGFEVVVNFVKNRFLCFQTA